MLDKSMLILVTVLLCLVAIPDTSAFIPDRSCINESYLLTTIEYAANGNITTLDQRPLYCPYGCMVGVGRYGDDCANRPYQLPLVFYLILLGATSSCLIIGVLKKRWILCFTSTIFFAYLAFQSFAVEIGSYSFMIIPFVILTWFATIVSLYFTLVGIKNAMQAEKEGGDARM